MRSKGQHCERHTIKLNADVTMAFRKIPACPDGFLMGCRGFLEWEEPMHRVIIPQGFWMAETPVTQAQFAVWTESVGIEHQNRFQGRPDHPAESMTWYQANDFCIWLTHHAADQLPGGCKVATLPPEAHGEYACRADAVTEYYTGDGEAALGEAGWYSANSDNATNPVRQLTPNGFGMYDMHGNVWEWCLDVSAE